MGLKWRTRRRNSTACKWTRHKRDIRAKNPLKSKYDSAFVNRWSGVRFSHPAPSVRVLFLLRVVDHLLDEIDCGFSRWETGGRRNVFSVAILVIRSARPTSQQPLGLGQPLPRPILVSADAEAFIECDLVHFRFPLRSHQPLAKNKCGGLLRLYRNLIELLQREAR